MKKKVLTLCLLSAITFSTRAQTIRKVLFEDYTGAWCGYCPEATQILEQIAAENPSNIIVVASHSKDALAIAEGDEVVKAIDIDGYPSGSIDRFRFPGESSIGLNRGYWTNLFNRRKKVPALATIGFSGFRYLDEKGMCEVNVNIAFTLPGEKKDVPIAVNIYILEDSIPATGPIAQVNFLTTIQGGASPLNNWYHNSTLRMAVAGAWGNEAAIPANPVLNKEYTKKFSFTIPDSLDREQVKLVAYIAYNGTVANNEKEIINAEEMRLPTMTSMVKEPKALAILGGYPNPVSQNEVFKLEYSIPGRARVRLEVYNIMGQLVSPPMETEEVSGAHTFHWMPSAMGLKTGMYFIKLQAGQWSQTFPVTYI